jgi:hypothetical protein
VLIETGQRSPHVRPVKLRAGDAGPDWADISETIDLSHLFELSCLSSQFDFDSESDAQLLCVTVQEHERVRLNCLQGKKEIRKESSDLSYYDLSLILCHRNACQLH